LAGEEGDGAGHDEGKLLFSKLKETKRNPWLAIPKGCDAGCDAKEGGMQPPEER
jgi:hypothetical protein